MPPPLLIGPIGKVSLRLSQRAIVGTADAALAFVLVKLAWNRLPEWIKEDVGVQNLFRTDEKATSLELTSLVSVIEKLQALFATASEKLSEDVPFLYATVLAQIQLAAQLKHFYPEERNQFYYNSGELVKKKKQNLICR